jgi:RNA polymerase sigma factor (sigma-70 family)
MTLDEAVRTLRRKTTDKAAWERFYLEVHRVLRNYVAALVSTFQVQTGETAEDIVHAALVSFLERWPELRERIDSGGAALAYLRASCRNRLVDQYRHERSAAQLFDFLTLKFREAFQTETEIHRSLFLREIIEQLPLECARLFTDYVKEDLSLAEIADRQDVTPAALYARWYRCIEQARRIFLQRKVPGKRL